MNINSEERGLINKLQEQYAINISQAFKLFLKEIAQSSRKAKLNR